MEKTDAERWTRLYKEADAARAIGINPATLRRYRKQGVGPKSIKFGKRWYYSYDALYRFARGR